MATNAPKNGHGQTPPPAVYFLSLTVNNFRAFGPEPVTLDLTDGHGNPAPWTILLGDNGTGKTTLLQLLAAVQPVGDTNRYGLDVIDAAIAQDYTPSYMRGLRQEFHQSGTEGVIVAEIGARQSKSTEFGFMFESHNNGTTPEIIFPSSVGTIGATLPEIDEVGLLDLKCFGYGASRRMSRNAVAEGLGKNAFITLFDDAADLTNAEDWLIRADYAAKLGRERGDSLTETRLQQILDILKEILPDIDDFKFGTTGDNDLTPFVRAKTPSGWVRVANLSLGYKTTLAWIVDFAARMFERYPKSENPLAEPAVCLVDEIDLHLHPRWQRKLITDLTRIFPKTQFIVTAHSPLIVQAAPNANLALLQWKGDHVVIDNDVDHIRKWRVDQILASELFGEQPVHAPEVEALFERRTRILSKPRLTKKDNAELATIDAQLDRLPTAVLPEDQKAMSLIREAAALLQGKNGA